jgi:hypothetical protein
MQEMHMILAVTDNRTMGMTTYRRLILQPLAPGNFSWLS